MIETDVTDGNICDTEITVVMSTLKAPSNTNGDYPAKSLTADSEERKS